MNIITVKDKNVQISQLALTKMHLDELNNRIQKMIAFRDELLERYQQLESVGAASGVVYGLIEREGS